MGRYEATLSMQAEVLKKPHRKARRWRQKVNEDVLASKCKQDLTPRDTEALSHLGRGGGIAISPDQAPPPHSVPVFFQERDAINEK